MRNRTELTQEFIDQLTPAALPADRAEKFYWDAAEDGLGVRLRRNGVASYLVRYVIDGREQRLFLGSTTGYKLADARFRAHRIRLDADDGKDAKASRRTRTLTLKEAITEYLTYNATRQRPSTYRQNKLYLTGPYFEEFHSTPVDRVTRGKVSDRLLEIEQTHTKGRSGQGRLTANCARKALSQLYTWLDEVKHAFPVAYNPVQGIRPAVDKKYRKSRIRQRVLSDPELAQVYRACGDDNFGRITRLLILTGCRRQEIGGLHKGEVDLANARLVLPPERVKMDAERIVYLAPAAVRILADALRDARSDHLFERAPIGTARKHNGFQSWSDGKERLDAAAPIATPWNLHDLRRTTRTGLGKLRVPRHIAELAIGHIQPVIERIYDTDPHEAEIIDAMNKWATHVEQLTGTNVVELRRA